MGDLSEKIVNLWGNVVNKPGICYDFFMRNRRFVPERH